MSDVSLTSKMSLGIGWEVSRAPDGNDWKSEEDEIGHESHEALREIVQMIFCEVDKECRVALTFAKLLFLERGR